MSSSIIQSLDRGLKILTILGKAREPLSLNEISDHFTIDRSSVFRLIGTLIQNNFVRQDEATKKYSLGFRVLEIAGSYESQMNIDSVIRPLMGHICGITKQNTHVGVLDGEEVVFIAVEQPRGGVSVNISAGTREPAAPTALGKAIIAFLKNGRREEFIKKITFKKYTDKSITTEEAYRKNMASIERDRVAFDNEEYKPGIACIAAPILNNRNEPAFSIGISGPVNMMKEHMDEYTAVIQRAARDASAQFGSTAV